MADDDELFEEAMQTLGTKRGARAAPRPKGIRPEAVTVSEDLDFEAIMGAAKGPAQDLSNARNVSTRGENAAARGLGAPAGPTTRQPIETGRHVATAEERREFEAAMRGLGTPPGDRFESPTGSASPAAPDLARALRRGEIESEAVLDLHGRTKKEARAKLASFIREARAEGWQIVTIIVGRGLRSDRGEAVLRPLVERWLTDDHRADVREVHEAPPHMGGSGAWVAAIRGPSAAR